MLEYKLVLSNIHCSECVTVIRSFLSEILKSDSQHFEIDDDKVTLLSPKISPRLRKKVRSGIESLGFDVVNDYIEKKDSALEEMRSFFTLAVDKLEEFWFDKTRHKPDSQEEHLRFCKVCKEEHIAANDGSLLRSLSSRNKRKLEIPEILLSSPTQFKAMYEIQGMTCASCSSAIETAITELLRKSSLTLEIQQVLKKNPKDIININVMNGACTVIIPNKQLSNAIRETVDDIGYSCQLKDIEPIESSKLQEQYKVTAVISGMSCVSCSNTVEGAVKRLHFVLESSVNHLSKAGVFLLTSNDRYDLDKLKEAVEDAGYDYELQGIEEKGIRVFKTQENKRTTMLKVNGMFCHECPKRVLSKLKEDFPSIILDESAKLSTDNPVLTLTYIPDLKSNISIFSIVNGLNSVDEHFSIEIVKPKNLNEELINSVKQETRGYLIRATITFVVAVPTFVFGIVPMSLLKKHNHFREWSEKAIISGRISRMDWILFFLATPVYLFVDYLFHRKAILEIRNLWKNGSLQQKFLKFGSMNLLISLGTSVAYIASIVQMVFAGCDKSGDHMKGDTTSYFDSVVFLTFFILVGKTLESFSKYKTNRSIVNLSQTKVKNGHLLTTEPVSSTASSISSSPLSSRKEKSSDKKKGVKEVETDVQLLEVGDKIRVYPGESPPLDAIILEGSTKFDENSFTGESTPVNRNAGDQVFAGTINVGTSSVICKVTSYSGDSLIDQIVKVVRDGQFAKARELKIEATIDVIMGHFVPIITCLAIITWIIWLSLGYSGALSSFYLGNNYGGWAYWSLEFAIAVFVIACPCGIGLVAPAALFVGSGIAARNGILARGSNGAGFEEASMINVVCFDKTGTLTKGGDPKVTDYKVVSTSDRGSTEKNTDERQQRSLMDKYLGYIRDLENNSNHPLAKGIKMFISEYCDKNSIKLGGVNTKLEGNEVSGKGLHGKYIDGTECIIGNEKLLKQYSCSLATDELNQLTEWKKQGKSIMILAVKDKEAEEFYAAMVISERDEVRPEARMVIEQLQRQGIECWMITGDNATTARAIATEVGIDTDKVVAEVLPEEKLEKIKLLKKTLLANSADKKRSKITISMVGDGINDAPALAIADVGIALASGSELAVTSADFILLSKKFPLLSILVMLKLSKKVCRRIKFSFGWAVIYNVIGIPIAAGVIFPIHQFRLSPVWASAAMALSSVSVLLSGLALNFFKVSKEVVQFEQEHRD